MQSHPRVFRPDQEALIGLADNLPPAIRVTVALTHADSIGPGDWDRETSRPGPGQAQALAEQVANVLGKLSLALPSRLCQRGHRALLAHHRFRA
jgi:hypothetical protein